VRKKVKLVVLLRVWVIKRSVNKIFSETFDFIKHHYSLVINKPKHHEGTRVSTPNKNTHLYTKG